MHVLMIGDLDCIVNSEDELVEGLLGGFVRWRSGLLRVWEFGGGEV